MSKVKLIKIWLCAGVLFAFLSGGTVSWFLNHILHPLEAADPYPYASESWKERFVREMGLDAVQSDDLVRILGGWEESRIVLQEEYRDRFQTLNREFEKRIKEILTPEQLERYEGGN